MIELTKPKKYEVDWPGWPLSINQFGDEFDEAARIRMIVGGKRLIPFIAKHKERLRETFLEIGPFFNPITLSKELRDVIPASSFILFLENDPFATAWLKSTFNANVLVLDMNAPGFKDELNVCMLEESKSATLQLDTVIISQVLNYIDFRMLFESIYMLMRPGGVLFINNVIDYGIPPLFSEKRPRNNDELLEGVLERGFNLVEKAIVPKYFKKETSDRLILVLEKI